MSDNPLVDTPERQARIRERAYHLWEQDGRPENRSEEYWERARELVAIDDSAGAGQLPNPASPDAPPINRPEEAQIQENLGEFPDRLADQGDWRQTPMTRKQEHEWLQGKTQPNRGDAP